MSVFSTVCVSHMHGVSRGVEDGDVVLQDVEMKGWSQQPPLARPLLPVA